MAETSLNSAQSPRRETVLAPFLAAGFVAVEPAILQPAQVFLDVSGEELARRLYLTTDAEGRELCLRPELTIPVCLDHMAAGDPARRADYAYFGRAFRHRPDISGEFWQAGVESLARTDTAEADAQVFALALDCARRNGVPAPRVRLGDTGLFRAVLAALDLPAAWHRRLARDFGRADLVAADLATLNATKPALGDSHAGLLSALAGADREAARALVEDLLAIGGVATVGGRSVGEIAERFLEQADLSNGARVPPERLDILKRYLSLTGDPATVLGEARDILAPLGAAVGPALEAFAARNAAFARAGIDLTRLDFQGAFGRRLDYYSGFVFEIHDPGDPLKPQFIGGGRYDNLLKLLGAPEPVPAVGFSVWVERLPGGGS